MFDKLEVEHYVSTPTVEKLELKPLPYYQMLVCGPRRVGKSTAVYKAMEGKSAVIHIALHSCSVETFFSAALKSLRFKHHEIPDETLLIQALENIKRRGGNKPTVMVEVNEKCNEKELTSLLLRFKDWGSDRNLARFIVVLSTSRAALLFSIPLNEVRVIVQSVEDPPEDTIKSYFEQCFAKCKNSTKQERDQLIARHTVHGFWMHRSFLRCLGDKKILKKVNKFGMVTFLFVFVKIQES